MTTAPHPVVVGVDGRPAALRAVAWAAREADRRALPVDLVAAVPDDADPVDGARRAHADLAAARRAALASAAVVTATRIVTGRPGPALAAAGRDASLVVVGSDGEEPGEPAAVPLSSSLVVDCACPVVVVPARWDAERHLGEVVVAVDPNEPDELRHASVGLAAAVAWSWQRPLLVVVVLPGAHTAPAVAGARRVFDACPADVGSGVDVHEVLGHGDPAEQLLDLVGPSTGLLVLGTGGLGPGPSDAVGRAVLRRARCPVALVPGDPAAVRPLVAARTGAVAASA
ncbi:universal stress protein [Actinomycetospora sp. TBRC 11914]|uniref:universal stress protein n=1 Tax=Actinomycetospora sp. TBRC 11914 TaxID=2729387 RepID=UPI00145E6E7A|nr:universal stress protein [Actinomycetospora sp. TBRC 11914]NMO89449.1 universal stress protein [Actinomycetospora sp. TBRC 11914]